MSLSERGSRKPSLIKVGYSQKWNAFHFTEIYGVTGTKCTRGGLYVEIAENFASSTNG